MSRLSQFREDNVLVLTGATALTENDNGKTIVLASTTAFAVTLPPLQADFSLKVLVRSAPGAGSHTIVTHASANVMLGTVLSADLNAATDADFEASGGDTLSFVTAKIVKGDSAELYCDGTNWYVRVFTSLFDAATITTAS